jgi:hypothetical protein
LIDVEILSSETYHFKAIIDFQWAISIMTAFSGAAGAPQLLLSDDDSDKPNFRTMKWVKD